MLKAYSEVSNTIVKCDVGSSTVTCISHFVCVGQNFRVFYEGASAVRSPRRRPRTDPSAPSNVSHAATGRELLQWHCHDPLLRLPASAPLAEPCRRRSSLLRINHDHDGTHALLLECQFPAA